MITIVPMTEKMANDLLDSKGLEELRQIISAKNIVELLNNGPHAYAGIDENGTVIFCAGVMVFWGGRGEAWAFFSPNAGRHFFQIHSATKTFLHAHPLARIEATVELNFPRGIRWIRLLGFKEEAPVMAHYRQGQSYALYSLIDPRA